MGVKNHLLVEYARHWNQNRGASEAQKLVAG
jgi:hypothetical protein